MQAGSDCSTRNNIDGTGVWRQDKVPLMCAQEGVRSENRLRGRENLRDTEIPKLSSEEDMT